MPNSTDKRTGLDKVLVDPATGLPSTFGNYMPDIGRGIEWCDWMGPEACYCCEVRELESEWPETKCPDLGDWSDTPHDELDGELKTDSEYRHPMADVLESILTVAD
jgi:hypothetical protein